MKKLSVMLCLIALLAFTLNGCGGSGTTDTSYYGGGDSGGTTTTPTVTSCTTNLTPGQTCSIGGSGFGSSRDSGASTVSFVPQVTGGTTLTATTYLSWSDTAIQCVTPSVVTGIQYVVIVNRYTSSGTVSSSSTGSSANMTTGTAATAAPVVASQSPNPATAGASVTLTGTNFPISYGYILVNGTVVSSTFTTTTAVFTVPSTVTANATVTLGGGVGGSTTYTLVVGGGSTTPTITSIAPLPVAAGAQITINGTNFGATQGTSTVTITGATAPTVNQWGATQILATLPATGLTAGQTYPVVVTVGGVSANGTIRITNPAVDPYITSLTPASVSQGVSTNVTIAGGNFGTTAGTVTITPTTGGTATTLTSSAWAAGSITVNVPTTVTAATYTLTVTTSTSSSATSTLTVSSSGPITGTWQTPNQINTSTTAPGPAANSFVQLAMPNGNVCAIFYDRGAARIGLYYSFYVTSTSTWTARTQLDDPAVANAPQCPSLHAAIDSNGNILAVWEDSVNGRIYWRYYTYASGAWNTTITNMDGGTTVGAGLNGNPRVAFDSNNDAVCIWDTRTGSGSLVANKYVQGAGAWAGTIAVISNATGTLAGGHSIAFQPSTRTGFVAYAQYPTSTFEMQRNIWARSVDTSKTLFATPSGNVNDVFGNVPSQLDWNAANVFVKDENSSNAPAIRFSGTTAMCIFDKCLSRVPHIFAARYVAATWVAPTGVTQAIDNNATLVGADSVLVRTFTHLSTGDALLCFVNAGGTALLGSFWSNSAATWSTWTTAPATVSGTNQTGANVAVPSLGADSAANAFCIYRDQGALNSVQRLYAPRYSSSVWTVPNCNTDMIDPNTGAAVDNITPSCVFNSSNRAFVLYSKLSGGTDYVYNSRWQ